MPQLLRGPRHAAAAVAVGGRREGHFLRHAGLNGVEGKFVDIQVIFFAQQLLRNGLCAAEHLEGVQAEVLRFILDQDPAEAKEGGKVVEGIQRRAGA